MANTLNEINKKLHKAFEQIKEIDELRANQKKLEKENRQIKESQNFAHENNLSRSSS